MRGLLFAACLFAAGSVLMHPVSAYGNAVVADRTSPVQPVAQVRAVTDTGFGTPVVDPYRWMEAGGPAFDAYLHAQSAFTRSKLDALPDRTALVDAMKASVAASGPAGRLGLVAAAGNRALNAHYNWRK